MFGLLSKNADVVVNHLFDVFEGCIAQHAVFITEKITSEMKCEWSGALQFELVFRLKSVNDGLWDLAGDQ